MSHENQCRALRLSKAWSQEQLAALSGLSTRTIQRFENGEQASLETLCALAAVFEVNVMVLTGEEPVTETSAGETAGDQRITEVKDRIDAELRFYRALLTAAVICPLLCLLNYLTSPESRWSLWVFIVWFTLLALKGIRLFLLAGVSRKWQQKRMQQMLRR